MTDILSGFKKHRAGRIHVKCRQCGRKLSNMPRSEFDPENAVLVVTVCEKHDTGCDGPEEFYYDADGKEIPFEEIEDALDNPALAHRRLLASDKTMTAEVAESQVRNSELVAELEGQETENDALCTALASIDRENEALRHALAKAQKDGERLDWLERQAGEWQGFEACRQSIDNNEVVLVWPVGLRQERVWADTLREAIDTAMTPNAR